uniref:RNA exonuclease 1 n=1 Tax=Ascaris suum TaxID=6253 RepID=F1KRW3_ASCSU
MIGRSGLFADIVCPDDEACWRPHCHFWHSKDDPPQESTSSNEQPFVGYVGYVSSGELQPSSASISADSSIYAPIGNSLLTYQPIGIEPQPSSYIASFSGTTNGGIEQGVPKERRKRGVSPLVELPKPRLPVDLPVDEILDPSRDAIVQPKQSTSAIIEKGLSREQPKGGREKKLNDYAKSVADIDTRIEELQRRIEEEKRAKERIVHEIKAKVKSTTAVDYIPSKKNDRYKERPKSSSGYSGGYTPTPIAVLKAEKASAKEKQKENERQRDKVKEAMAEEKIKQRAASKVKKTASSSSVESTSSARQSRPKTKFEETLSIEELFDDDEPAPKKTRISRVDGKRAESPQPKLTDERVEAAKRRMAETAAAQATARMRMVATKSNAPNVAQQLTSRYERLQREKEEIMKRFSYICRLEGKTTKTKTSEEEFDYKAGASAATIGKGEKRIAHTVNVTKAAAMKLMPLDPYTPCKVPYALRTRYLALFHDECVKFCASEEEAIIQAQQEEKGIKDRAVTKGGYTSAAVHVLKRLREAVAAPSPSTGVKSVSHNALLAGRHHGSITLGSRKHIAPGSRVLSEREFYDVLDAKYVLTMDQLVKNGYPIWEDESKKLVKLIASERDSKKKLFADENDYKRVCCRCGAEFCITPKGDYARSESCVHHWGRAFKMKTAGAWESRYNCCSSDLTVKGCCVADYHVTDTAPKSELLTFRETPSPLGPNDARSFKVYALDCEMVYTPFGLSLARISVVDMNDDLVLDVLIRPKHRVVDCNTRFSGLTVEQLEAAECNFEQAQERLFELVNSNSILIGHSLESDLKAMRLVHHKVVDTSVVFPHRLGPPYKRALKTIASEVLQLIIQEDVSGHDSKEDSSACMRLMLHKVKHG